MKSPDDTNPDDAMGCRQALEPAISAIIHQAIAAGWPRPLVLQSLKDIATNPKDGEVPDAPHQDLPAVGTFDNG